MFRSFGTKRKSVKFQKISSDEEDILTVLSIHSSYLMFA